MTVQGSVKKVGVVLVNWNGGELTIPCIESLMESDHLNCEIIVVDDGSTDGSPEQIAEGFPDVEIIRQPANLGVSEARNRGIERAWELGSDYVLILDNDTRVDRRLISHLVATAKAHDDLVCVGPKIYWLHDPNRLWYAYGRLSFWTGIYTNPVFNAIDRGQFEKEIEMDVAGSCCLLIPKKIVLRVGGFDPAYTWNEDVDWSLRCRQAGFRLLYCPSGKVWHLVGGSSSKLESALKRYLLTRNQLWTLRKIVRPWHLVSIALFYPPHCFWRLARMILNRQWDCIRAELKGAKDGFFAPLSRN